MNSPYTEIIRRHSRPLVPQPTHLQSRLAPLPHVEAVLFDIYGTLLISASGDIDPSAVCDQSAAFDAAAAVVGAGDLGAGELAVRQLNAAIAAEHERARQAGIGYPEIDIREIWRIVFDRLQQEGFPVDSASIDLGRFAVEYEVRVNPVWPMPKILDCLHSLQQRGCRLGVISNAQFLTPQIFPALLDHTLAELGFDPQLLVFSYEHRQAKPSRLLYDRAMTSLAARSLRPDQVAFVGNDMWKDIMPAQRAGMRTVLFAGDARSLRLRSDEPQVSGLEPDLIVCDLLEWTDCVGPRKGI